MILKPIDIDTMHSLSVFERTEALKRYWEWRNKAKQSDKQLYKRELGKIWNFKNKEKRNSYYLKTKLKTKQNYIENIGKMISNQQLYISKELDRITIGIYYSLNGGVEIK